ncbi:hypothetical protein MtrunA17_Chr7g0265891 [Medicago truncatula]|uniref:DUF247 domain protein n=1 Tax=Medicago truncatula TaxID=3880 RepID=A0A396H5T2_MEDTR|nr:UPF0481 protein At3g47200 [Medicago truncatula]RHN48636.1 hypothetical protein MtrunA17_Chr7g0265891 [Medicago truncatula]
MRTNNHNNEESNDNHYVIDICKVDNERLASLQHKISENPKLLSKSAGKISCCIFKVPQTFVEANVKAYHPRIVSIGPYHRGQPRLNMIEEHKYLYLGSLLTRTQLPLEEVLKAISLLENEARECYSETIQLDSHEFVEMMVLDGCFIIELFRKVARLVPFEVDDPLVNMAWILPFFYRDFLKLENQIPFFVLQRLFEISKPPNENSTVTLSYLAMEFFNNSLQRPEEEVIMMITKQNESKHLLDLVRSSFIPISIKEKELKRVTTPTHIIHCVTKLRRSGIKINPGKSNERESFLNVKFKHGVIEMPTITMDDFMSSFLFNCVAFEQCYSGCTSSMQLYFTTYVTLLDCLINTYRDVEYLCERNIVENHFGTEGEMAHLINNAGKDVAVDLDMCYLSGLFDEVHQYYGNSWHVQWASFKYTYFDTPWSFISALAALVLLVLTVGQTYFAAYQYFDA